MNIVKLPVSPFTKKLIIARYGQKAIPKGNDNIIVTTLKASDDLTGELMCVKAGDENKVEKTLATLTDSILIQLTPIVAKQVNRRRWRVGLHLEDYYRTKLNEYIQTRAEAAKSKDPELGISASIKTWCEKYDIELDVDINYDALYKDYQRFREEKLEKNQGFFVRQKRNFVRRVGQNSPTLLRGVHLFSDSQLDAIIAHYATQNAPLFKTTDGTARKKLHFQLSLYVYRIIGNRPPQYICQKFNLQRSYLLPRKNQPHLHPRTDFDRRLRYAVRAFKIFLHTAPPIELPHA
jgi:hypothetical protein